MKRAVLALLAGSLAACAAPDVPPQPITNVVHDLNGCTYWVYPSGMKVRAPHAPLSCPGVIL